MADLLIPDAPSDSSRGGRGRSAVRPEGDGLRVIMGRIDGLTKKGLLTHPFLFQCPPTDSFRRQHSYSHFDYDTVSSGQFSRPVGVQLLTVTFTTLMVDWRPPWSLIDPSGRMSRPPNPLLLAEELADVCEAGTPFQLYVHQARLWTRYDVNMAATLRSITVEERAGEPDGRYTDVAFSEFRDPTVPTRRRSASPPSTTPAKAGGAAKKGYSATLPTAVTIKTGGTQTLYSLATYYYGSPGSWRTIVAANPELQDWPPSSPLGDFVKGKRGGQQLKVTVPRKRA